MFTTSLGYPMRRLRQRFFLGRNHFTRQQRSISTRKLQRHQTAGELFAQRQAVLSFLQRAGNLRRQAFRTFENHILSGNSLNFWPQRQHRFALGIRPGQLQFDNRHRRAVAHCHSRRQWQRIQALRQLAFRTAKRG